jgi:hypothetical protein
VRAHVGVEAGVEVYWHTVRRGEAVLTKRERRAGGHPEGLGLARQLDAARAEVERLQRKLRARPDAALREGVNVGIEQAMRSLFRVDARLGEIEQRLASIDARLPFTALGRRRRASDNGRTGQVAAGAPPNALASPSLSPVEVERGADTSGAQPPGVPAEH